MAARTVYQKVGKGHFWRKSAAATYRPLPFREAEMGAEKKERDLIVRNNNIRANPYLHAFAL